MALRPESLHDLMRVILACVCEALDEAAQTVEGQPGCPCRACLVAGAAGLGPVHRPVR